MSKYIVVVYDDESIAMRKCGIYDGYNEAVLATLEAIAHYNGYQSADEWEDSRATYDELYDYSSFSQQKHMWSIFEIPLDKE